jgi:hypothetical protein
MNESNKTGLIIAFVVVVVLFLRFGGGAMSGSFMGRGMMGGGTTGRGSMGGYSWMWIPALITWASASFLAGRSSGRKSNRPKTNR